MQKLLTFFQQKILAYMPYLMIKDLTIHSLTTSLVLNNWALVFIFHKFWFGRKDIRCALGETQLYLMCDYHIYPKYCDTFPYYTGPKIWTCSYCYLLISKICCMSSKQYGPCSDAPFCGIWSGSTLFAQARLSQCLGDEVQASWKWKQ